MRKAKFSQSRAYHRAKKLYLHMFSPEYNWAVEKLGFKTHGYHVTWATMTPKPIRKPKIKLRSWRIMAMPGDKIGNAIITAKIALSNTGDIHVLLPSFTKWTQVTSHGLDCIPQQILDEANVIKWMNGNE